MKLTNRQNLPEPLYNAVANDPYDRGDADTSITELLKPPRACALAHANKDKITEDASDRIFSLLGQACHTILERAGGAGVSERRMWIMVEGWKVSGATDHYHDALIQDYKVTTVWKVAKGVDPDFERQLNMLAEIHRQNGHKVTRLQIVAILRDWSKMEARRSGDYPQAQVVVQDVPMWPAAQAQAFIRERVLMHRAARHELPECTPEEKWQKPDFYAVMKKGGKRAVKLHTSKADADAHAAQVGGYVVKRPGEATRCASYCSAAPFCSVYQASLVSDLTGNESEDVKPNAKAVGE